MLLSSAPVSLSRFFVGREIALAFLLCFVVGGVHRFASREKQREKIQGSGSGAQMNSFRTSDRHEKMRRALSKREEERSLNGRPQQKECERE